MKKILFGVLMVLLSVGVASAEPQNRLVTLKDGTTVQGKIMGIDKGAYVIESSALGTLRIQEGNVASISSPVAAVSAQPVQHSLGAAGDAEFQAAQSKIMSNPALMAEIQAIASDPEVVAIISDPAFMQAAQAKDMAAIQANPRTAQLMNNPKIKALIEKMQASR